MFFGNPPPFHRVTGKFCLFFLLFCLEKKREPASTGEAHFASSSRVCFSFYFFFCELFRSRGCPRGKLKYFTWKAVAGKKRGVVKFALRVQIFPFIFFCAGVWVWECFEEGFIRPAGNALMLLKVPSFFFGERFPACARRSTQVVGGVSVTGNTLPRARGGTCYTSFGSFLQWNMTEGTTQAMLHVPSVCKF